MKQGGETRVPEDFRPYFWDIEFEKLEVQKDIFFITKRILDRGNFSDIRWLIKTYGIEVIKKEVLGTRDLDRLTGNFWADILGLDKKQVPCLQKPYFPIHFGLSS